MSMYIDAEKLAEFPFDESSGTNEQIDDWIDEVFDMHTINKHEDELRDLCWKVINGMLNVIKTETIADVQPVRHGKWIELEEPYINTYECSNCGRWFALDYGTLEENDYNYCPNCGAKMEEEENE